MAKMSTAEIEAQKSKMKDVVAAARKKPQNFAMQISKTGIVLETDLRKPTGTLWRVAKQNGGSSKGAAGTLSVEGNVIRLVCESGDVPGTLQKQAKAYLSSLGLAFRLDIVLPGAGVLSADAPPEDAEAQQISQAAEEQEPRQASAQEAEAVDAPVLIPDGAHDPESGVQIDLPEQQDEEVAAQVEADPIAALMSEFSKLTIPFMDDPDQKRGLFKRLSHFSDVFRGHASSEDLKGATASLTILKKDLGEWKVSPVPAGSVNMKDFPALLELSRIAARADDLLKRLS